MEGQPILSPQKLAPPKQNNHQRPPTEGSAAAGPPMSPNRDVIHLPLNLHPPPGDVVPQPPQIQPPGKNNSNKKISDISQREAFFICVRCKKDIIDNELLSIMLYRYNGASNIYFYFLSYLWRVMGH